MPTAKKQPTVESLMLPNKILHWVRQQPSDMVWNYNSPDNCLLACYMKDKDAKGFQGVGGDYVRVREEGKKDVKIPITERVAFGLNESTDKYSFISQKDAVNGFKSSVYGNRRG